MLNQDYDTYCVTPYDALRVKPLQRQIKEENLDLTFFVSVVYHHYCSYDLIQKNNREIRRTIRKFYKDNIRMIFFNEQHKSGSWHCHILVEDASEIRWKNPASRMTNFLLDNPEDLFACTVGNGLSLDRKKDLLRRVIRTIPFISTGQKSVDVEGIFNQEKLLCYCTKQFEVTLPSYEIIDSVSSDVDVSHYLTYKQSGLEWLRRTGFNSVRKHSEYAFA